MVVVAGRAEVEEVAIDGGVAGGDLGFEPAPGGVGDEAVAGVVAGGAEGFGVGGGGVDGEEVFGVRRRSLCAAVCGEAVGGERRAWPDDLAAAFVGVPAGEERDVGLLAGGVDARGRSRGGSSRRCRGRSAGRRCGLGGGGFDDVVGGELAEVGELGGAEGGWANATSRFSRLRETERRDRCRRWLPPLSPMALAKRPRARGEAIWALTEKEPADSPKMVMLVGSPPKAAMLRLTQARAAVWSMRP